MGTMIRRDSASRTRSRTRKPAKRGRFTRRRREGARVEGSMKSALAQDQQHPPVEVEVLATGGVLDGVPLDHAMLDRFVANFHALRDVHNVPIKVPVKIGHDAAQPTATRSAI